jgi:hypothetical protein
LTAFKGRIKNPDTVANGQASIVLTVLTLAGLAAKVIPPIGRLSRDKEHGMKRFGLVLCGLGVGLLAAAAPAQAALITGNLGVSGDFVYDNLVLTTGNPGDAGLDFETTASLPPPPEQDTEGVLVITGGSGYFQSVGVVAATPARIANITNVNPPTDGNYAYLENGVDLTLTPFENFLSTFSAETGLSFNVTEFVNQLGPGCPALPTCAEGPFLLTQSNEGFDITFDFIGFFYNTKGTLGDTSDDDSGFYKGHFVTSIVGLTFDELGARLIGLNQNATNGFLGDDIGCGNSNGANNSAAAPPAGETCTFTATFSPFTPAVIPEPATLLTFGVGSAVLAARARRRKKA